MVIDFFGYAFGMAGSDNSTALGPKTIKKSLATEKLKFKFRWNEIIDAKTNDAGFEPLKDYCQNFTKQIHSSNQKFCVFGGDHTSAIASVQAAQIQHGRVKLIWVDAHMDMHNLASSHSKNIHGMSLAVLLGHGDSYLKQLKQTSSYLQASDVCIFGVRSYEPEEKQLLEKLGVNIIYMQEISDNGLEKSLAKAFKLISISQDDKLMLSIDLDAFDPEFAPAVTVPEANGLDPDKFCAALESLKSTWQAQNIGCEIVEFSPKHDVQQKTEHLITKLLNSLFA